MHHTASIHDCTLSVIANLQLCENQIEIFILGSSVKSGMANIEEFAITCAVILVYCAQLQFPVQVAVRGLLMRSQPL